MQINSNYGSLENYNSMKSLFKKNSNISDKDFDVFYENYQSELYEKKGFSDLCKEIGRAHV